MIMKGNIMISESFFQQSNVLIVDDNPVNLNVLRRILMPAGYKVYPVRSGEMALKVIQKSSPDIILLDIMMPQGMDGYEVCRRLKADGHTRDIPVIFISALDETGDKVKAFESGGVDYIIKPFQAKEVLARLKTHLSLRHIQNRLREQNIRLQQEIEERRQIAEALRQSEEKYRLIAENSKDVIWTMTSEGQFTYVSPSVLQLRGYTAEEAMNQTVEDILTPASLKLVQEHIQKRQSGPPEHFTQFLELEQLCKDGTTVWTEVVISPIRDHKDNLIAYVGVSRDTTERRRAEEKIRFQAMLLEQIKDTVVATDLEGRISYANEAAARMIGKEASELIGQKVYVFGENPERGATQDEIIHQTLTRGKWEGTVNNRLGDGSERLTELRTWLLYDDTENARGMVGVGNDVTERIWAAEDLKNAKEEAEKAKEMADAANQAKSEFLANMSHEIRTPMNAVLGFSEILLKEAETPRQKSYLTSIYTSGQALLSLINDILDLSKIEAGKLEIHPEPLNIRDMLNEIKTVFSQKIQEKGLSLEIIVAENFPRGLVLDEVRLRQILINLVGNAVKFTSEGYIRICVYENRRGCENGVNARDKINAVFKVEDTGIGIPKDQQAQIFESFQQQKGQKIKEYGGTGLGLAITKKLAEMMNGTISVESETGRGSIFRLVFYDAELTEKADTSRDAAEQDVPAIQFEPALILVADDVLSNRAVIRGYLEDTGLSVIEAESGEHALSLLNSFSRDFSANPASVLNSQFPVLILMDLRMPGRDGYEITQVIKSNDRLKRIPIIAFTAHGMKGDEEKIAALFDGYLRKPISKLQLISELKKFLPYQTLIEKKSAAQPGEDSQIISLSEEAGARLPEFMKLLENEIVPKWDDLSEVFFIDDIAEFALELKQTALEFHLDFLADYSEKLYEQARNFDIEALEIIMAEFPAIAEKIRTARS
jgi:PAS domain S-box-containing protein